MQRYTDNALWTVMKRSLYIVEMIIKIDTHTDTVAVTNFESPDAVG